jgi:endonuclease YncB( thermonuclease family)
MRTILTFLLFLLIPQLAMAGNSSMGPVPIRGDFTELKQAATARVDKVIDGQTVLMTDGKIVRLLGIDYPFMAGDTEGGPSILGKAMLELLLPKGKEVLLYQNKSRERGRLNRMGHSLAHLVIKDRDEWVNGALVSRGLAWTATDATNPAMAAQLYALEDAARKAQKGLWSKDSPFGLLTPETAAQGNGTFRVIEGTVNRAATSKNNLYLNFGSDWRKDFTVMVTPAIRKGLAKKGVDAMALAGRKIRVRGWLREWNGPFMELETPERLEVLISTAPSPVLSTEPVDEMPPAPLRAAGQINP